MMPGTEHLRTPDATDQGWFMTTTPKTYQWDGKKWVEYEGVVKVNILDRVHKPSPSRLTANLRQLLLGAVIGAAIMVALFLLGFWAEMAV
jgi:hypothetical protein